MLFAVKHIYMLNRIFFKGKYNLAISAVIDEWKIIVFDYQSSSILTWQVLKHFIAYSDINDYHRLDKKALKVILKVFLEHQGR